MIDVQDAAVSVTYHKELKMLRVLSELHAWRIVCWRLFTDVIVLCTDINSSLVYCPSVRPAVLVTLDVVRLGCVVGSANYCQLADHTDTDQSGSAARRQQLVMVARAPLVHQLKIYRRCAQTACKLRFGQTNDVKN